MCKIIKSICLASAVCVIAAYGGLAQTNNTNSLTLPLYGQIEHQLLMFETNKLAESVRHIDDSIDFLETVQFSDRKEHARTWIEILTMIDKNMDTNFDIMNIKVAWYVTPPPDGKNGIQYQPGVPPETLKDPEARSNYEAAIRENNEKGKKADLQVALFHMNKRASSSFEEFLKSAYTPSETDKTEIGEMIDKATLSPARKQRLNSIMGISPEIPSAK